MGEGVRIIGVETGADGRTGALAAGEGVAVLGAGVLFQNPHAPLEAVFATGVGAGAGVRTTGVGLGGSEIEGFAALAHTLDSG